MADSNINDSSMIWVRSPRGDVGQIPIKNFDDAEGWSLLAPEEVDEYVRSKEVEKQYGTTGEIIKTMGISALNAGTIGLAGRILGERGLGLYDQEEMAERNEAAGWWGTGAEVGTVLTQAALSGGLSLYGQAAKLAMKEGGKKGLGHSLREAATYPLRQVAGVSDEASQLAYRGMSRFVGDSAIKDAVKKSVAHGVGGATDGFLYSTGMTLSEQQLGSLETNSERMAAQIAFGALAGGILGSATTPALFMGKEALKRSYKAAKTLGMPIKALDKGFDKAQKIWTGADVSDFTSSPDAKMNRAILDEGEEVIEELGLKAARKLNEIDKIAAKVGKLSDREAKEKFLVDLQKDTFSEDNIRSFLADFYEMADERMVKALKGIEVRPYKNAASYMKGLLKKPKKLIEKHLKLVAAAPGGDGKPITVKLKDVKGLAEDMPKIHSSLNDVKRELDGIATRMLSGDIKVRGKVVRPGIKNSAKMYMDVSNFLRAGLRDESVWGEAARVHSRMDDVTSELINMEKYSVASTLRQQRGERGYRPLYEWREPAFASYMKSTDITHTKPMDEFIAGRLQKQQQFVDTMSEELKLGTKHSDELNKAIDEFNSYMNEGTARGGLFDKQSKAISAEIRHDTGVAPAIGGAIAGGVPGLLLGSAIQGISNPAKRIARRQAIDRMKDSVFGGFGVMSTIEDIIKSTGKTTRRLNKAIFDKAAIDKNVARTGGTLALLNGFSIYGSKGKDKDIKSAYKRVAEELAGFDPQSPQVRENLDAAFGHMNKHAPQLTEGMIGHMFNAVNHLKSKLIQPAGMFYNTLQPQYMLREPSEREILQFTKHLRGLSFEMVVDSIENDTITKQEVETFKAIYPVLFAETQELILEAARDAKNPMPYGKSIKLGMLFEVPTHPTMAPEFSTFMTGVKEVAMKLEPEGRSAEQTKNPNNRRGSSSRLKYAAKAGEKRAESFETQIAKVG